MASSNSSSSSLCSSSSSSSSSCALVYLSGDGSGAGKSSVALALLAYALKNGYSNSDLAYIKPCTQCESVQLVSKFAEENGIAHVDVGPIVYYAGYTYKVIDGEAESIEERKQKVRDAVHSLMKNRRLVIVDGVGYPALGSCIGLSNGVVASLLSAPVLIIGRAGVGHAIDSMNACRSFYASHSVAMLGAVFNKLPKPNNDADMATYHKYEQCVKYTTAFFQQQQKQEQQNNTFTVYGHIPKFDDATSYQAVGCGSTNEDGSMAACSTKTTPRALKWAGEGEKQHCQALIEHFHKCCNFGPILADIETYSRTRGN